MKQSRIIISVLFWGLMGFILAGFTEITPVLGMLATAPMNFVAMPSGVLGVGAVGAAEEEALLLRIKSTAKEAFDEFGKNKITSEELETRISKITGDFEKTLNERSTKLASDFEILKTELEAERQTRAALGAEIVKIKADGKKNEPKENMFVRIAKDIAKSACELGEDKVTGKDGKMEFRDISLASDYTGTISVSKQSGVIVDENLRLQHLTDGLIPVSTTNLPYIEDQEMTDWDFSDSPAAENGAATTSTFKIEENTWLVKRIPILIDRISKRLLQSQPRLEAKLIRRVEEKIKATLDYEMLNGDGSGVHFEGLLKKATQFSVAGPSFVATAFLSVATWNAGVASLVTFNAEHKLRSGYKITIANATAAAYNATHTIEVLNSKQIIINVAYVAEANNLVAAWTASTYHPMKDSITDPNEADVLLCALNLATVNEFVPNYGVIHPWISTKLFMLQNLDNDYKQIPFIQRVGKTLVINGVPFVETTAMSLDKFLVGTFTADTCELAVFSALKTFWGTDVDRMSKNQMALMGEIEAIFPVYNPVVMYAGDFATAIAALKI